MTTQPISSYLGRRPAPESNQPTKKARVAIPENLMIKKLPKELLAEVFLYVKNPAISSVSRTFRETNSVELNQEWEKLEALLRTVPELTRYLDEMDRKLPGATGLQRCEFLYREIAQERSELFPGSPVRGRMFDPTFYIESARLIDDIHSRSLEEAWPEIRFEIFLGLNEQEPANLPPEDAQADEIRTWLHQNQPALSQVRSLSLDQEAMLSVPPEINLFTQLRELDLSNNEIRGLHSRAFEKLTHLRKIYLHESHISFIPENLFANCPHLEVVDFYHNLIKEIPPRLFANCPELKEVNLSVNRIRKIPEELFRNNPLIERVFFNANEIDRIPDSLLEGCEDLRGIEFTDNFISHIPPFLFLDCSYLQWVSFSENNLIEIPEQLFLNKDHLETVAFDGNLISSIPSTLFSDCRLLQSVSFNKNSIESIDSDIFENCLELEHLQFKENQIESISPELCENCFCLKTFDMQRNPIEKKIRRGRPVHANLLRAYSATRLVTSRRRQAEEFSDQ